MALEKTEHADIKTFTKINKINNIQFNAWRMQFTDNYWPTIKPSSLSNSFVNETFHKERFANGLLLAHMSQDSARNC